MEVPGRSRNRPRAGQVARALGDLPVIREEFAAARLSYAKVRALTRIATPETERDLADASADDNASADGARAPDVSAETPATHPACPLRCHFEDGGAVSPAALRLIGCNATISTMVHDTDGGVLNVGRRTRKPSAALRRAVRERDGCRCRFPGCESRRTDAHHILYWSNGGETKLRNLISLCKAHHRIVHDKSIVITATGNGFAFSTPEGVPIPPSPALPAPSGGIAACHNAAITPATIIPPYSGERLDLNMAIWVAFTNARIKAERRLIPMQGQ